MTPVLPRISWKTTEIPSTRNIRHLIAVLIFCFVVLLSHFNVLERFELVTYDYRMMLRGDRPTDPRIAVIEISDDSVDKIGRWPWNRSWHATLIKILSEMGAKAVIFDVIFSESSELKGDAAMAQAIQDSGKVYLAQVMEYTADGKDLRLLSSLPFFTEGARGEGHINLRPDVDGVMRRMTLVKDFLGRPVPQMAFRVALDEMGAGLEDVRQEGSSLIVDPPEGESFKIPLDPKSGEFILNWAGRWHETFSHFSYIDVVSAYAVRAKGEKPALDLNFFKDKFCFVGTSATGLFDIRPTPLEPAYPAVGVNMTVLNNLLERRFIHPFGFWLNTLLLLILMLIMFPIMRLQSVFTTAMLIVLLAVVYIAGAVACFIWLNVWINVVYSVALMVLVYFFITLYNQLSVSLERARLMKLATRDALTGLYNVGHFKLLFKAELTTLAMRREKKLSIIMSDVDNFKKTNDTYGHVTGDLVLKEVAKAFRDNCRALDVAGRYGGEEFILMLPGADAETAAKVAEKIRASISEKEFAHEKGNFKKTISLGVTAVDNSETDMEVIVQRADKALYEAKNTGKNKVVIAKDSPKP